MPPDQTLDNAWQLYVPVAAAAASALDLAWTSRGTRANAAFSFRPARRVATPDGLLGWKLARALGCTLLLVLGGYSTAAGDHLGPNFALVLFYLYASALAIVACFATSAKRLQIHLGLMLALTFLIFAFRDLWPLATYTLRPADRANPVIWPTILLVASVGVLIPLAMPTPYMPVNPLNPAQTPAPEQTASLLSFLFFAFVDPLVKLGYRSEHLSLDMLPPVADYDRADHLRALAFPSLSPLREYILWPLLRIFKTQVISLSIGLCIRVVTSFGSPVGLNRLLNYIETGGEGAIVRPWVWISLLFLDPMLQSIGMQWYFWTASRLLVRTEAVVTQLVFAHALKIRKSAAGADVEGKMNNLVTSDLANITAAKDSLVLFINVPLQVIVCLWFLYALLGWSSVVGILVMLLCFPLPGWIATKLNFIAAEKMKRSDARVQQVTETMSVLRMIKMFAWERKMQARMGETRAEELTWIRRAKLVGLVNTNLNHIIPLLTMVATYTTFTVVMRRELTASIVFSSMALFDMLRNQLESASFCIPMVIGAKVSLDRLTEFLRETPLLDQHEGTGALSAGAPLGAIGFHDAAFTYTTTPSSAQFSLRIPGTLFFKRGALNLIVGPTGSGKTSLLLALLGELHFLPEHADSWYGLPREGGVAYAAQEGWVENKTIRENILFGAPYDARRYKNVLRQCALENDLEILEAGDMTEVGERGVTLSGGQKARVTLARAVYSQADVMLLDDVFSALDVHTGRWIADQCLNSELLRGRTVLLVTHNVPLVAYLAQNIVVVKDGVVRLEESPLHILRDNAYKFAAERDTDPAESGGGEQNAKENVDGGLVEEEKSSTGRLGWPASSFYLYALGGVAFWTAFLVSMFSSEVLKILQTWFLGHWASMYDSRPTRDVPVGSLLGEYALLLVSGLLVSSAAFTIFVFASMKASSTVYNRLIGSVLGSTMRWLDVTPTSRIIARSTQDLRSIDGPLADLFTMLIEYTTSLVCKFATVIIVTPVFAVPGFIVFGIGWICGHVYMKAQMPVKREMSKAKSPVLSHFGAAVSGLVSIRAYGAENRYGTVLTQLIDKYTRAARASDNLTRWVCIRVHAMGGLFAAGLATFLVYGSHNMSAGTIGFSLAIAISFSGMTLAWVMITNMFEVEGNSLERILDFVSIEQEPAPTARGTPPAYWPSSGELRVDGLSAKYSKDGPAVLQGISFSVDSGERIGVVGRTGSGKTSLTLALLRCILTSGQVVYDGFDTRRLNLEALRSNITIIPQHPELLAGSLRQNLDPFDELDDATLNAALVSAGLRDKLSLDMQISSAGANISHGIRQMVALARALVRRSKIVILDEATAAIDYETDGAIQRTLRTELKHSTLITVAHRLRTIMDFDRVMVLDKGQIVEFDAPASLIGKPSGYLRSLLDESPDRDELLRLVGQTQEL